MLSINIPIISDTYTTNENPNTNFASSAQLYAADRTEEVMDKDNIWLHIPLDALPSGSTIVSAYLYMYCTESWVGDGSGYLKLRYVDEPWNEGNITKTSEPSVATDFNRNIKVYDNDHNKWYALGIQDFVESWVAGTRENYGLRIGIEESSFAELIFVSSQGVQTPYVVIEYELPALVPINLEPFEGSVINLDQPTTFTWDYLPSYEGDVQTRWELGWSIDQVDWTKVYDNTSDEQAIIDAGTFPEGEIYWRLKVRNGQDNESPYTNNIKITATKKPDTPVITTNGIVNVYRPVIEWEAISTQKSVEMQITDMSGTLLWESGKIYSSVNQLEVGIDLENTKQYIIKIKVGNAYDLYSDWGEKIINTSFQVPEKPFVTILHELKGKGIIINVSNPETGVRVIRNEVFRREIGESNFMRIAKIEKNDNYIDYAVKNDTYYEYYVRAVGETNGYLNSDTYNASISLIDSILTDLLTLEHVTLRYNPKKQERKQKESSRFNFAGRVKPVTEFGEHESIQLAVSFEVLEKDLAILNRIYESKGVVLFRDSRGRRLFCTIDELSINDNTKFLNRYTISIKLEEEDYSEEVV